MELDKLMLGGVYAVDTGERRIRAANAEQRLIRVILFDDVEVHYDVWWTHTNSWSLKAHRGAAIYGRYAFQFFMEHARFVRVEELDENELEIHRPDLPIRLCRLQHIAWSDCPLVSFETFIAYLRQRHVVIDELENLEVQSISLIPFGPKGGPKKPVQITADNGSRFTGAELLYRASTIQSRHTKASEPGIGIYRSGVQKRRPSYYIGGFHDLAGFTEEGQKTAANKRQTGARTLDRRC